MLKLKQLRVIAAFVVLALQLHFLLEMGATCFGLMGAPPE